MDKPAAIERARRALQDCRFALEKFNAEPVLEEFRLTLVLCLTLLRAIGHVLQSEAKENAPLRTAIDKTWNEKKLSPIFTHFIEEFRNKIVKEYRSPVRWASHHTPDDGRSWTDYLITDGHYKDKDVTQLIQEGIDWWDCYFNELEAILEQLNATSSR